MSMVGSMVMAAPFAVMDAKASVKEGDTPLVAVTKGVGSQVFYEALGPWGFAVAGAQIVGGAAIAGGQRQMEVQERNFEHKGQLGSGVFDMNEKGYTMRQRSLNAIQSNGLNLQSTLGNEARTYYRSNT